MNCPRNGETWVNADLMARLVGLHSIYVEDYERALNAEMVNLGEMRKGMDVYEREVARRKDGEVIYCIRGKRTPKGILTNKGAATSLEFTRRGTGGLPPKVTMHFYWNGKKAEGQSERGVCLTEMYANLHTSDLFERVDSDTREKCREDNNCFDFETAVEAMHEDFGREMRSPLPGGTQGGSRARGENQR